MLKQKLKDNLSDTTTHQTKTREKGIGGFSKEAHGAGGKYKLDLRVDEDLFKEVYEIAQKEKAPINPRNGLLTITPIAIELLLEGITQYHLRTSKPKEKEAPTLPTIIEAQQSPPHDTTALGILLASDPTFIESLRQALGLSENSSLSDNLTDNSLTTSQSELTTTTNPKDELEDNLSDNSLTTSQSELTTTTNPKDELEDNLTNLSDNYHLTSDLATNTNTEAELEDNLTDNSLTTSQSELTTTTNPKDELEDNLTNLSDNYHLTSDLATNTNPKDELEDNLTDNSLITSQSELTTTTTKELEDNLTDNSLTTSSDRLTTSTTKDLEDNLTDNYLTTNSDRLTTSTTKELEDNLTDNYLTTSPTEELEDNLTKLSDNYLTNKGDDLTTEGLEDNQSDNFNRDYKLNYFYTNEEMSKFFKFSAATFRKKASEYITSGDKESFNNWTTKNLNALCEVRSVKNKSNRTQYEWNIIKILPALI